MPITFFKPADSFSVFNKKSNHTLAKYTKAEKNLQDKINKVTNILKKDATKHNIIKYKTDNKEMTLYNNEEIKNTPQDFKLVADALMRVTRFNNELKDPVFIKKISKLSKLLDEYDKQTQILKYSKTRQNEQKRAKISELREIVGKENELADIKYNSGLPEVVKKQEIDNKKEIAKISETRKIIGKDITPECFSAREKMAILIEYITANRGTFEKQGIFRESGVKDEISAITQYMDTGIKSKKEIFKYLNGFDDIHNIIGAFKEYFKLTLTTGDKKIIQGLVQDHAKSNSLKKTPLLNKLPSPIQELLPFLAKIARNHETNLMTADNLAIVFAPHFQQNSTETDATKPLIELIESYISYVNHLISYESNRPVPSPRKSLKKV
ncbi:TPA: hypothetical protein U5D21_000857 [Yersinia enterocolitica]|nr:hypothetical protein [Yersinia enterocolitica]